jgi:hypothetical protein
MIDLNKTPRIKIHVPTPEISEKVQKKLFEMGCKWMGDLYPHVQLTFCTELYVNEKTITQTRNDQSYFKRQDHTEVKWFDLLSEGFKVGDKVRAFGCDGVVTSVNSSSAYPVHAEFHEFRTCFTTDGRLNGWHKEPSLFLVERPIKKIKKKFYIWREGDQILDTLLDDEFKSISGKIHEKNRNKPYTKIEGTETEIEVLELF